MIFSNAVFLMTIFTCCKSFSKKLKRHYDLQIYIFIFVSLLRWQHMITDGNTNITDSHENIWKDKQHKSWAWMGWRLGVNNVHCNITQPTFVFILSNYHIKKLSSDSVANNVLSKRENANEDKFLSFCHNVFNSFQQVHFYFLRYSILLS